MASATHITIQGAEGLNSVLRNIPVKLRSHILGIACQKAAVPFERNMKAFVSVRTGALKASIGTKVIKDRAKGTAAALIGPMRGYFKGAKKLGKTEDRRGAEQPANYAHLVEMGHVIAKGGSLSPKYAIESGLVQNKRGRFVRRRVRGKVIEAAKGTHGGLVPPKPFIRPAFAAGRVESEAIMIEEIGSQIIAIAESQKR